MIETQIGILSGVAVSALGGAALIAQRSRREARVARQRALEERAAQEAAWRRKPQLIRAAERMGQALGPRAGSSPGLREQLARAGYHHPSAAAIYLGYKLLAFAAGLALGALAVLPLELSLAQSVVLVAVAAGVAFFLPNLAVSVRRERRRAEVQRHLPDAIDLLEICVASGMGIDMAWNAVSDEIRRVSPVLADEMELASLETSLGVVRATAMRHMAERTGAEDISSLVALLVQSERFGTGLVDALHTFAHSMRESRSQRTEEAAEKMSVKLLFPMVLFIFPVLFIIMCGPALLQLLERWS
jgi:tight adherence protein C